MLYKRFLLWSFYVNVISSDLVSGERKYNMLQYRGVEVILNKNIFSFLKKLVLLKWMLKTEQNSV
jgi:HD superfamily phosphodiesterase